MADDNKDFDDEFSHIFDDIPGDDDIWTDGGLTSETENLKPRLIKEVEVKVLGVYEHTDSEPEEIPVEKYFILLRDDTNRRVAIWIGKFEAYSISMAMEHASLDRPMTHDLMCNVIEKLGSKVIKILIDDIWQETYYAKISMQTPVNIIEIDSRPSDAIAVALRARAPIFMAESVLEQSELKNEA
ncbi:MAG: bifunctional nuclease family protein [Armatimonadota bacterium]